MAIARPARAPRPSTLWAIAAAGCAAIAISVAFALSSDHLSEPGVHAALLNWITLTYVSAGLVAWWCRPESRFGPLMVIAGFAIFLSSLSSANVAVPYTIGVAFDLLPAVLFLHVFLAFPSGRLEHPVERVLVGAGYVTAFGAQLVGMALGGFGPDNLLNVLSEPDAAYALLRGQLVAISAFCLAGIGVLFVRRRAAGRPARRWIALLVDAFALGLVMIAFLFLSAAFGLVQGEPAFETIRRLMLFVIGLAPVAFLVGLLSARLARSAVGDLVVELRADPAPGALRDALARALRDPSLTLVYWLEEFGSWADVDGKPIELPARGRQPDDHADRARRDARRGARARPGRWTTSPTCCEAVAAAAAIALENARLQVGAAARVDELRGSRARLVEAGDAERRRLERNLHDGAQQRMVVASRCSCASPRVASAPTPRSRRQLLTTASDELALSLSELRELARGIHPAVLEHGLAAALESLATRATVPTTVSFEASERLPERVEFAAYFVASEALANVSKYAQASAVTMRVRRAGPVASIEIADDGVGGADDANGSGLRGLADRVAALDGTLRVVSPPGAGTVITAEMPCGS